jgi:hypothetical protein
MLNEKDLELVGAVVDRVLDKRLNQAPPAPSASEDMRRAMAAIRDPDPAVPTAGLYAITGEYTYPCPQVASKYGLDLDSITLRVEVLFQENLKTGGWRAVNVRVLDKSAIEEAARRCVRKSFAGQFEEAERLGDTQRAHALTSQAAPIVQHAVYVNADLPVTRGIVARELGKIPGFKPESAVAGEGGFAGLRGGGQVAQPAPIVRAQAPQIDAPTEPTVSAITSPLDLPAPTVAAQPHSPAPLADGVSGPARSGKTHVEDAFTPPPGAAAR